MAFQQKADLAQRVIEHCKTSSGFVASTQHYPELWIRDLVFSEDRLLALGYSEAVRAHLEALLRGQRSTGQLPTVITTSARRIFNQRFHFWIADGEILFIIGLIKYAESSGEHEFLNRHALQVERCLNVIEKRVHRSGFVLGMDWRDAIPNYWGRALLSNQLLLAEAYELLGRERESSALQERIGRQFYLQNDGYYADSLWWVDGEPTLDRRFDSFGNSLAIQLGIAPSGVASSLRLTRTPHGYRNLAPPHDIERLRCLSSVTAWNAFARNGAVFRNRGDNYQNSGIWPFVESRIMNALDKAGRSAEARHLAEMMVRRQGFNEWYTPGKGEPRGSRGQLWTAAATLDALEYLS